jgi:predicted acetyltransferase
MTEAIDPSIAIPNPLQDGDLLLELVDFKPHPVHKVPTYFFIMLRSGDREELGSISFRPASIPHVELYAGHIGYGVLPQHRGHRYASRAVRLLVPLARQLGLHTLWITCDPDNLASRRSCELAGAEFVEIIDVPADCIIHQNGHPRKCRYRLTLSGSPEPACP